MIIMQVIFVPDFRSHDHLNKWRMLGQNADFYLWAMFCRREKKRCFAVDSARFMIVTA